LLSRAHGPAMIKSGASEPIVIVFMSKNLFMMYSVPREWDIAR
jgi:hypothetical protein